MCFYAVVVVVLGRVKCSGVVGSALGCSSWGGVDVLRGHLGCNLDDAGFVDDASCAVAFLYDADDPGLVALAVFGRFDLGAETGSLLTWKTDQQATCRKKQQKKDLKVIICLKKSTWVQHMDRSTNV